MSNLWILIHHDHRNSGVFVYPVTCDNLTNEQAEEALTKVGYRPDRGDEYEYCQMDPVPFAEFGQEEEA